MARGRAVTSRPLTRKLKALGRIAVHSHPSHMFCGRLRAASAWHGTNQIAGRLPPRHSRSLIRCATCAGIAITICNIRQKLSWTAPFQGVAGARWGVSCVIDATTVLRLRTSRWRGLSGHRQTCSKFVMHVCATLVAPSLGGTSGRQSGACSGLSAQFDVLDSKSPIRV